jgi:DNA-binding NarL/FixJ family response regulator
MALTLHAQPGYPFVVALRQEYALRGGSLVVRNTATNVGCQGGEAPTIRVLTPDRADLTPREAQLADLARRGLGNVEIAERLGVSVRTVESHIYRAMQKLDIADRREL